MDLINVFIKHDITCTLVLLNIFPRTSGICGIRVDDLPCRKLVDKLKLIGDITPFMDLLKTIDGIKTIYSCNRKKESHVG